MGGYGWMEPNICHVSSSSQHPAYNITSPASNITFHAIFVYAANLGTYRDYLWSEIDKYDFKPCCRGLQLSTF